MKRYKCHKEVDASPIVDVYPEHACVVTLDDGGTRVRWVVPEDFFARGIPKGGDYLIRYIPHGYMSWSPKEVFEDGYDRIG